MDATQSRFLNLVVRLGITQVQGEKMFEDLLRRYTEPIRAYHNLDHLIDIFEELQVRAIETDTGAVFDSAAS